MNLVNCPDCGVEYNAEMSHYRFFECGNACCTITERFIEMCCV